MQTPIVEKQVDERVMHANRLMAEAIKMESCTHEQVKPELQNTFKPTMKKRCQDCGAWME